MKKPQNKTDIRECARRIKNLLIKYNCTIETDEYYRCWLRYNDTDETIREEEFNHD